MRTWVVAIVVAVMVTGCSTRLESFACTDDASCGVGGKCEPSFSLCSFANDAKCGPGGRTFGDLGGPNSGQCVGSTPLPDGGTPDGSTVDARLCFGDAPFAVCLAAPPQGPLMLTTSINTDTSNLCVATTSGGTGACVVAGTTITVNSEGPTFRATGSKPLVLVASSSITVMNLLDVSSHHTANPITTPEAGAGADFNGCPAPTAMPSLGGGGAGGSFNGAGGSGVASARASSSGGAPGAAIATVTALRGGCPGQDGEGAPNDLGKAGHGGGGVLLVAGNSINLMAGINAAGEGGRGGLQNTAGGGGGGAGGMIVLNAHTVTNSAILLANGGGGGEGSGENTIGGDGSDPATIAITTPAPGGALLANGGDGGVGSAVAAGGPGSPGAVGTNVGGKLGGGGAGGGGAGIILVPGGVTPGGMISPTATTF
jgi:hypothetical protein